MTADDYQKATSELARSAVMPNDSTARLETALREAFDASAAGSKDLAAGSKDPALRRGSIGPLAAAAVVIALGAGAWYVRRQPVTSNSVTRPSSGAVTDRAGSGRLQADRDTGSVSLQADRNAGHVRLQGARRLPKILPPVIRPQGFVAVPTAAGLPEFESGVIVRLSLPVTALPSYGVDISPAGSDQPVEADVLVGQDGLARAIRLVKSSRSRQ